MPAGLVFATDHECDDGHPDEADPAEEEKKSTVSKRKSKDAKVDAKAKSKKKEPNKENVLNKCAAQVKGKEVTALEEFKENEVYYLVYERQKSEKEIDIETKVSDQRQFLNS